MANESEDTKSEATEVAPVSPKKEKKMADAEKGEKPVSGLSVEIFRWKGTGRKFRCKDGKTSFETIDRRAAVNWLEERLNKYI